MVKTNEKIRLVYVFTVERATTRHQTTTALATQEKIKLLVKNTARMHPTMTVKPFSES